MNASEFVARILDLASAAADDSRVEIVHELHDYDMFYVHVDDRGPSVSLGFDARTSEISSGSRPEGVEFFVIFEHVISLAADGWGFERASEYDVVSEPSSVHVQIAGHGWRLSFTGSKPRIVGPRTYALGSF